jgi:hypothetical protein
MMYIPKIREVVEKTDAEFFKQTGMHVFFEHGYHSQVTRQLRFKNENPYLPKKYPLIWLVTPIKEKRNGLGISHAPLHFVLAHDTDNTYSADESRDNVFLPILIPLYEEFIKQMYAAHRLFTADKARDYDYMNIQYAKVDTDNKNLLDDFVDVIDIQNFIVQVKNIC